MATEQVNGGSKARVEGPRASSAPKSTVAFHVTGFGVFNGIPDNPTTHIVEALPEALRRRGIRVTDGRKPAPSQQANGGGTESSSEPGLFEVQSRAVLHVSAEVGGHHVAEIHGRLDEATDNGTSAGARGAANGAASCEGGDGGVDVLVHCGVDGGSTKFALETLGYNEASFRVPDEMGYNPMHKPVDPSNPDISHVRATTLPIPRVMQRLGRMGWGQDCVRESTSAGRFVCNYVYYLSLGLSEAATEKARAEVDCSGGRPRHSLFLHVPPFRVIPKERQLEFVVDCFTAIAEELRAGPVEEDDAVAQAVGLPVGSTPAVAVAWPVSDSRPPPPVMVSLYQPASNPGETPPSPSEPLRSDPSRPSRFPRRMSDGASASIWDEARSARSAMPRQRPVAAADRGGTSGAMTPTKAAEEEMETMHQATRRALVMAGFDERDVDAAMATTGSDNAETNMMFLLDVTPLLPQGAPASGDVVELRKFLRSASERRVLGPGDDSPSMGRFGGYDRGADPLGRRSRTNSVGSRSSMAGVSPKWILDIQPRGGAGNGSSPDNNSTASTPSPSKNSLLNKFRRHRKSSSVGEAPSQSGEAPPRQSQEQPKRVTVAQGSPGAKDSSSPEYARRTTGNSNCQSPQPFARAMSGQRPSWASAGWDSIPGGSKLGLVLVVRLDKGLGPGAVAAQCCRAALAASRKAEGCGNADDLAVWRDGGEPTVVLTAADARELGAVLEVGATQGLPITMVKEKGAGWSSDAMTASTCTVAALGPAAVSTIFSVARTLPVL